IMRIRALILALSGAVCLAAASIATAANNCTLVETKAVKNADGTTRNVTKLADVQCKSGDADGTVYYENTNAFGYMTSYTTPNPVNHQGGSGTSSGGGSGSQNSDAHTTTGGGTASTGKPKTGTVKAGK